jgi:hypothetical protein
MANKEQSPWTIVVISLILVIALLGTMYFFKTSKRSKSDAHHHGDGEYHSH